MKRKILVFFFLIFAALSYKAVSQTIPQFTESGKISLLTVTPSDEEPYTLFGHTAIRIKDDSLKLDVVFNYGIFSFEEPNFIFRFVKGQPDFAVIAVPYERFIVEYQFRGVGLYEQVFNLTAADKQNIWQALVINAQPENRIYRYNFLYDNCATRPRDIVEQNVSGVIEYTPTKKEQTYRDLIHECMRFSPWTGFGIDLIIGSGADEIINDRQKDFLPRYLCNTYTDAKITQNNGELVNLVQDENFLLMPSTPMTLALYEINNPMSIVDFYMPTEYPIIIGCLLLLITLIISYLSYKKNLTVLGKIFDTLLFLVAGAGGSIIFFLMFFSEHPCVAANWNLVWLNPLQLIAAFLFFVKPLRKCIYYYHFINFVALLLFLLAWSLIPQYLEIAFIPYILSLMIRSGINILQQIKNNKA